MFLAGVVVGALGMAALGVVVGGLLLVTSRSEPPHPPSMGVSA